jgi:hypothetical protein
MFSRLSFIFLMLMSCGRPAPSLEGLDLETWKSDKDGCLGKRISMLAALQNQKEKLLGLSENQIMDLLGRPDQNELYERNQKFYTWFLLPAPTCGEPIDSTKKLIIRFNAIGLAKEVAME